MTTESPAEAPLGPVPPAPLATAPRRRPAPLRRASEFAWRALVVAVAVLAAVYGLTRLWFVVLPVFVALLLATFLAPPVAWLESRRWPSLAATWAVFGAFTAALVGIGVMIVPAIADEFSGLAPTLSQGLDNVEAWLVDGPLNLEPNQLDRYRREAAERIGEALRSSSGGILAGALALVEFVAGFVVAVVLSFFFVKDGRRFQRWVLAHLPDDRQDLLCALAGRAWKALGGYLRGAAFIGVVEALVVGATLWLVGAGLVLPVAVVTFFGAFFPVVGAAAAGVIASLVALVSGGVGDALLVAVVVVAVQQFDTDLLAPLIYGRIVSLHPAVVLITLSTGATVAGVIGAFLAVPVAAVAAAVGKELWERYGDGWRSAAPEADAKRGGTPAGASQ